MSFVDTIVTLATEKVASVGVRFGSVNASKQLTMDGETVPLSKVPVSLVPVEANRRMAFLEVGRTLLGLGTIGGQRTAPAGSIQMFGGTVPPTGWLLCDGALHQMSSYPELYAVIGGRYGASGTTFATPNMKGRVPVGYDAAQAEFNNVGKLGGDKAHTLSPAEMPSHTHTSMGIISSAASGQGVGTLSPNGQQTSSGAGSTQPHNNLQPYITLNYIIKT